MNAVVLSITAYENVTVFYFILFFLYMSHPLQTMLQHCQHYHFVIVVFYHTKQYNKIIFCKYGITNATLPCRLNVSKRRLGIRLQQIPIEFPLYDTGNCTSLPPGGSNESNLVFFHNQ